MNAQPTIRRLVDPRGTVRVELSGRWDLRSTRERTQELLDQLAAGSHEPARWDLTQVDDLDAAGATLVWRAWNGARPAELALRPEDEVIFGQLATLRRSERPAALAADSVSGPLLSLGRAAESLSINGIGMLRLLGDVVLSAGELSRSAADFPWREMSAVIYRSGLRSLPITALVGFLIGIVLSYLAGEQLHDFGADSFIINLMGVASLRELGPLLAAILNAGQSGSSMTAQIGVMRVTSELEAMSVLGISHTLRLVLPRVLGQLIALPLVVLWTDAWALIGGMVGAKLQLGVSYHSFIHHLPQVVTLTDLWFGLFKAAVFGALIALVSCYFGLRIRPDTEGLAAGTTESVVTSLTLVLLVDAVFAVLFAHVGVQP
jgi:phospholipid/cholesterol/gamma-HCH transport system permease protein